MIVPLIFSAFIHLWNPAGFPAFEQDEGHYMRRAMQVLEGFGPQESTSTFFYAYDHPYFGQVFLAAILSLISYPDSLNPSVSTQSIETLFMVPRILMGVFAVFDTFLVYKIADVRYGRKVAFISSILFAVMPLSWILRRIYLDSIELPFILLSILFALYYAKKSESYHNSNTGNSDKNIILILLSGIFLGLAIFTKVPVFTMIPLIVFIILKRSNKVKDVDGNSLTNGKNPKIICKLKFLGIWFIPVILIPMIWPAYAISVGQLNEWLDGVLWQATRADRPFGEEIKNAFFRLDPVLLGLGAVGLIYAIIKKDYFISLWAFPYLIFLYFVNWVYFFHLIPVFAAFCIIITILTNDIAKKIRYKRMCKPIEFAIFGAIIVFGFINSIMLITLELNNSNFVLASLVTQLLPSKKTVFDNQSDEVTLIGPNGAFSMFWIPSQVFNKDTNFKWFEARRDYIGEPIKSEKIVMVVDKEMRYLFTTNSTKEHIEYVTDLYNNSTLLYTVNYNGSLPNLREYPYTSILDDVYKLNLNRRGMDWSEKIEIKAIS